MISAAGDLYGVNSNEYISVINAWYAVGVGGKFQPYLSSSSIICPYTNPIFSLVDNVGNNPITWTCSSSFTLVSASGNNATFRTTATTPQGAAISASYGGTTITKTVYIIYNPSPTSQNNVNASTNINYTISPQTPDITAYRWVVQPSTGAVLGTSPGLTFNIRFTQAGTYVIYAYGSSRCGESSNPTHIYIYNVSSYTSGYSYAATVYPNPVSDNINIEIKDNDLATADNVETDIALVKQNKIAGSTFTVQLYDVYGRLIDRTAATKGSKTHISVAHLKNGIYYLHIYDESTGKTEYQQIVVKH
jgi:hypothetical protein